MLVIADTHVHLYATHPLDRALPRAVRNLHACVARYRRRRGLTSANLPWRGVLCLAERQGEDQFAAWRAHPPSGPGYRLAPHADPGAIILRAGEGEIVILCGRQIVTSERLEVLALGVVGGPADGQPLADTLRAVRDLGTVPVLPWSPGKWSGSRRAQVQQAVTAEEPGRLALADVGMRCHGVPEPRLLVRARRRGFAVLAGSDPLPSPADWGQAGRYGSAAEIAWDDRFPCLSFLAALRNPAIPWIPVGRRNTPWRAVLRQVRHRAGR